MQQALSFPHRHRVTHEIADHHVVPNLKAATGLLVVAAIMTLGTAYSVEVVLAVKVLVPIVLGGVLLLASEEP